MDLVCSATTLIYSLGGGNPLNPNTSKGRLTRLGVAGAGELRRRERAALGMFIAAGPLRCRDDAAGSAFP